MGKEKLKRILIIPLTLIIVSTMVLTTACTPSEAELVEGILQNVDAVSGEITIVTKDGKTVTLQIATEAPVDTEGASSALETLEPGVSVEVEVNDDGQVIQSIKAHQAKVEGMIVEIEDNEVTVESEDGQGTTVLVTDLTRIELEDDFPGTLADLQVGVEVEIKFDPDSRVAFKIDAEEEEAEIEGFIVEVDGEEIAIETEHGRRLTLSIGDQTRIELEDDIPGTVADLQVGVEVEAKFDPFTRTAFKIEVEVEREQERETEREQEREEERESDEAEALEAIEEVEAELAEMLAQLELEGITLPADFFDGLNALLAEAKNALADVDYEEAERLAEAAEEILSDIAEEISDLIEELEGEGGEEEEEE